MSGEVGLHLPAGDQFARFSLWTANIGVFASGLASLDHSLREAQEVHEVITGLLEVLDDVGANRKSQAGLSATTLAGDKFKKVSAPSVISGTKSVAFDNHEDLPFPIPPLDRVRRKYKNMKRVLEEQHKNNLSSISEKSKSSGVDKTDDQVGAEYKLLRELKECWDLCLRTVGEVTCPFCFYAIPAFD